MTTTSTDPRDIEAELERDRAELASTLDELSDRVSVDSLARDALDSVKSYAGSYTATLDGAVRTNPVAVAMVGAGLAWLAFSGNRRGKSASTGTGTFGAASRTGGTSYAGGPLHDDAGLGMSSGLTTSTGSGLGSDPMGGLLDPAARGTSAGYGSSAQGSSYTGGSSYAGSSYAGASSDSDDDSWWSSIGELRSKATAALHRIEQDARSALSSVGSSIAGGAGGARDFASERASVLSGFASDLKDRLSHGLDSLPDPARQRILATRERAYAASLQAERAGRQAITDPARALEEHPLVAGAVAFALGAAVAAMLPRTEAEDQAFGGERDRLMDEAARLLRSERERAMQVAGGLVDEVKSAASGIVGEVKAAATDAVSDVVDTAKAKATEAASRVGERATEEAHRLVDDVQGGTAGSTGQGMDQGTGMSSGQGTAQGGDQGGMRGSGDPVVG